MYTARLRPQPYQAEWTYFQWVCPLSPSAYFEEHCRSWPETWDWVVSCHPHKKAPKTYNRYVAKCWLSRRSFVSLTSWKAHSVPQSEAFSPETSPQLVMSPHCCLMQLQTWTISNYNLGFLDAHCLCFCYGAEEGWQSLTGKQFGVSLCPLLLLSSWAATG